MYGMCVKTDVSGARNNRMNDFRMNARAADEKLTGAGAQATGSRDS
jgi:hypothetical protein